VVGLPALLLFAVLYHLAEGPELRRSLPDWSDWNYPWLFLAVGVFDALGLIALNILFFRRKKLFPVLVIVWMGIGLASLVTSALAPDSRAVLGVHLSQGLAALVWIPYFLRSRRVKNTFIH
jgi:hypothetical protein